MYFVLVKRPLSSRVPFVQHFNALMISRVRSECLVKGSPAGSLDSGFIIGNFVLYLQTEDVRESWRPTGVIGIYRGDWNLLDETRMK